MAGTVADAAEARCVPLVQSGALPNADLPRERNEEARNASIVGLSDRAFVTPYHTDAVCDLVVSVGVASNSADFRSRTNRTGFSAC